MDVLSSLCLTASTSSVIDYKSDEQQESAPNLTSLSKSTTNPTVPILPTVSTISTERKNTATASSRAASIPSPPMFLEKNEDIIPRSKLDKKRKNSIPLPISTRSTGKRKRVETEDDLKVPSTPTKRKASNDYLRKGQWTSTEERLARLLIEAFEEGYLPIYTGIRLRGYLAVQLQCDPMRVSKKLCAGMIDGKAMPKNYGQKKFKLRKRILWDSDEAACRISELESLTMAMWTEARMRKPSYLTLSTTHNMNKKKGSDHESDSVLSPSECDKSSSLTSSKKQEMFPIIYLNLSKLKHYSNKIDDSDSNPASSFTESDSDGEPVRLDGESLQAAYDLLTLCSPRIPALNGKTKLKKIEGDFVAPIEALVKKESLQNDISKKCIEEKSMDGKSNINILIKDGSTMCISTRDQVVETKADREDTKQNEIEHLTAASIV
ncbi:uncharacterized protein PHALS_09021 [Plasmopara halstedii]|uniref:Uncharacterized protein n=1 Tax=Plasmopara halstedii TaxID=4781 RepID=A0A0N7L4L1_PLAHL|nr:uncharacterized protein PHALS_09021 [Plasmopara halstedii]CEG38979.1 hypothetical protein PHALS_09021 [Plasmopara halstedii]|eukprot:XP_024575348.1 hypothetical protein PHALS_09021 [Plasmopara halstedii]